MKDIYHIMNTQNILKYYGSKLEIRLDSSEFYDYELTKNEDDYDRDVLDLSQEISYSSLVLDSTLFTGSTLISTSQTTYLLTQNLIPILTQPLILNNLIPLELPINVQSLINGFSYKIRRRTEAGWTIDLVFNRNSMPWSSGGTFYYWGIKNETDPLNYLDNNLSFAFTDDGRITWKSVRYSGYCDTNTGYTSLPYISSGITDVLCSGGTIDDFEITITFDRYNHYDDCRIENDGGWNDLVTGRTLLNINEVITGGTPNYVFNEVLNKNWSDERNRRLGVLKFFLNGKLIYKLKDWEEVIPSQRNSVNPIVQIWGGGTDNSGSIHSGVTEFEVKRIKYFEEPLSFPRIRHHYLVSTKPFFNITECTSNCVDVPLPYFDINIITENILDLIPDDGIYLIK